MPPPAPLWPLRTRSWAVGALVGLAAGCATAPPTPPDGSASLDATAARDAAAERAATDAAPERLDGGADASLPAEAGTDGEAGADAGTGTDAEAGPDAGADGDVAPRWSWDLDGDGTAESLVERGHCADGAACLLIRSAGREPRQVPLPAGGRFPAGDEAARLQGETLRACGDLGGSGAWQELAVGFLVPEGSDVAPALAVVDPEAGAVLGWTRSPPGLSRFAQYPLTGWMGCARRADGGCVPYLAPSYGDSSAATWGYLCAWRGPGAAAGRCGAGFAEISTVPPGESYWFREVGAYHQDVDGDGDDEIHLIYHWLVLAVSPRSGRALAATRYDVAAADEPAAPPGFHSGRNYGTHEAFTEPDGSLAVLQLGAAPVGSFADLNCNVSRFVALLRARPGLPASRRLAWSHYSGFASTTFSAYDPAYRDDPSVVVARLGDFADGCLHRFETGRVVIDGTPSVLVNYFRAEADVDTCLQEQYDLYLPPTWTPEKSRRWYACFERNLASPGSWNMAAYRLSDGRSVTGSTGTYVWGWSDRIAPGGELLYLVEVLPGTVRFDLADTPPSALRVYALVGGLWTARGTFPVAGRPRVTLRPPADHEALGSFGGLATLVTEDRDGDGLLDVQLEDGTWVGWREGGFAVVP